MEHSEDEMEQRRATGAALAAKAAEEHLEWKENYFRCKDTYEGDDKLAFKNGHVKYDKVRKIVKECDVLLHVLDAREPLGTRCESIVRLVNAHSDKKLVYILNKADLVPLNNLEKWLT